MLYANVQWSRIDFDCSCQSQWKKLTLLVCRLLVAFKVFVKNREDILPITWQFWTISFHSRFWLLAPLLLICFHPICCWPAGWKLSNLSSQHWLDQCRWESLWSRICKSSRPYYFGYVDVYYFGHKGRTIYHCHTPVQKGQYYLK